MSFQTIVYDSGLFLVRGVYALAGSFSPKARSFRQGRVKQGDQMRRTFENQPATPLVWVHCASLGEFEQGRPVIEALKAWKPSLRILLTFFSPSGFEVRKDYEFADYVFYLPWDTRKNARWFAEHVRPALAIFVKYEFWYHYTTALKAHNIPLLSISSIFRQDQVFFKSHGGLFRKMLANFNHFFVQNTESVALLKSLGITQVTQAGDSRFDRVYQLIQQAAEVPIAKQFKDGQKVMVIGSAWPEDMDVLFPFMNENLRRIKFIVAPHELKEGFLSHIERSVQGRTIRYSHATSENIASADVLLIDNIGLLSRLYAYGEFAFIGGGFSQGLHNILEAACYGIPVFFGNQAYQKYQEAVDLVMRGGAFDVRDFTELKKKYEEMTNQPQTFLLACEVTRQYVLENLGATDKIVAYAKKFLN